MAVSTFDEFFGVLKKSELLTAEQLAEARLVATGLSEPTAIARKLVRQHVLSRWQASQIVSGKHSKLISKYRLLDLLRTEPLGPVYLAQHTQMDRRVVLKTLAVREGNTSATIERFLNEAQSLATLDHRNLSHVYDVDREGDFYYLVMEYVQGRSLDQLVQESGPMTCEAAAGFVTLAADALEHAHRRGIHHLGIRPDRLIVDTLGELKVMEIGMAQLADTDHAEDPHRESVDSRSDYLAPEQVLRHGPLDERTDVYSLGCVLYFLLAGRPPFAEGSEEQRRRQRCEEPARDVRARRKDVPPELAEVCLRMTARRPQDRFGSAASAAGSLEAWLKQVQVDRATARAMAPAPRARTGGDPEPAATNGSHAAVGSAPATVAEQVAALDFDATPRPTSPRPASVHPPASRNVLYIGAGGAVIALGLLIWVVVMLSRGPSDTSNTTAGPDVVAAAATEPADHDPAARPAQPPAPPVAKGSALSASNAASVGPIPVKIVKPAVALKPSIPTSLPPQSPVVKPPVASGPIQFHALSVDLLGGMKSEPQPDGSYYVVEAPATAVYTIHAHTNLTQIRGFRLEAFADRRLPGNGPGRCTTGKIEGSFVVSNFSATMTNRPGHPHPRPIPLTSAESDVMVHNYEPIHAIDKKYPLFGWGIGSAVGHSHWATFTTAEPFGYPRGTWLTIRITQTRGKSNILGRFRVTLITGDQPGEDPGAGAKFVDLNLNPFSKLVPAATLPTLDNSNFSAASTATKQMSLGTIDCQPTSSVKLQLLGGNTADEDKTTFSMDPTSGSDQSGESQIRMRSTDAKSPGGTVVARVKVVHGELFFQWTEQALLKANANFLRNCVLEIALVQGGATLSHGLALRSPIPSEGLGLGFGKTPTTLPQSISWVPGNDQVKMRIIPYSAPKNTVDQPVFLVPPKSTERPQTKITFSEPNQWVLEATVEATLRNESLRINVKPYYRDNRHRFKFDAQGQSKLEQSLHNVERDVDLAEKRQKASPNGGGAADRELTKQIQKTKIEVQRYTRLQDRVEAIEKAGPVPFQIFFSVGNYEVLLVDSSKAP